jgi:hypothetical protein
MQGRVARVRLGCVVRERVSCSPHTGSRFGGQARFLPRYRFHSHVYATRKPEDTDSTSEKSEAEETAVKYGLEAGLWKVFTSKDGSGTVSKGQQAKDLLKRYGSAYLVTSISFAIVSFAACYTLVNAGVDVAGLLGKVGLTVSDTSEKVGTFAIAYAAHKALSPVRFPPTVALTPVVAKWLGKSDAAGGE